MRLPRGKLPWTHLPLRGAVETLESRLTEAINTAGAAGNGGAGYEEVRRYAETH